MNKDLHSIAIFVTVVETGGFSKAAEKLELSNSVVSHHVTKLEDKLGVTLLYRSTRRVTLSDQGRAFYTVASRAISDIEVAIADLTNDSDNPVGVLNIALPTFMPDTRIEHLIWDFAAQHQGVEFSLSYSDDRQDLISDGIDIAFRVGRLESTALVARKIADITLLLVASPSLRPALRRVKKPEDLSDINFITLKQFTTSLTLSQGRKTRKVDIDTHRVQVDNIHAGRDAAIAGLGVITLPVSLCERALAEKKLEQVLPQWQLETIPLFAVWNNKARRNSLTRRLLTFISEN